MNGCANNNQARLLDEIKAKIAVQGAGVQNSFDIPVSASNKQEMRDDNKGAMSGKDNVQVINHLPEQQNNYMLYALLAGCLYALYNSNKKPKEKNTLTKMGIKNGITD